MKPFVHKKAAGGPDNKNREKIRSADRVNNQRLLFPVTEEKQNHKAGREGERAGRAYGLDSNYCSYCADI